MQIMTTEFCGPFQPFRIQVTNRDQEFLCPAGSNLLKAMERKNSGCISVGCRGGGCGLCKIRVVQGEFHSKRMSKAHISDDDLEQGVVLACRISPASDLVIESDQYQPPVAG
ncbi:2Fe-2S iron-sulfur cluster binding domain-containing protein [Neptuniibacter sp. CAU 1671]|uniref:2Fe-2S iron-sulfur cluster-binding protein n=1 Tax=Neptuniibacter sp. CAU 1671 TaxID=3032593 RepID=UPI0023D9A23D|nr:2Fe-2S iron-sulfur cluster binding domain-containing protein [Neptuniibacter sp. CAU 1671]MDF2180588.1 2Fe-2S iron-sulfur cluster binding domain-containing protein [Neptuniibacter sp. CAU 1671]